MKTVKTLGIWLACPLIFPILLTKFFGESGKISWKIWCLQLIYLGCCIYGFLDWLNGWTPDLVVPPIKYSEPSELACDSGFYASANSC
jgi:hypothetical protein